MRRPKASPENPAKKPVVRRRKKIDLTLSDETRENLKLLAAEQGLTVSRLVEMWARREVAKRGG